MPKIKVPPRLPLTREEVERMIQKAGGEMEKALVALLYLTGARISEVIELRKEHFTFVEGGMQVEVRVRKRRETGPLLRFHSLFLGKQVPFFDLIEGWVKKVPPGGWVFPSKHRGKHLHRATAWRIIKRLEPTTFPHFFRHTRASLLARTATITEIRDWLGRKTLPGEYITTSPSRLRELGKSLD